MLKVKLLLVYIDGPNYRNGRMCCMFDSDMQQDSMFHIMCVCENPALVDYTQTLYDMVIAHFHLRSV